MNIYDNNNARKAVLEGAKLLYEPVKTTLGPKGRNVLIRDKFGKFTVTHDGVTVAKSINLKDDPKSIGVELIKEASKKMDEVGDGTTSVTVLAYHLMKEADALIEKGESPMMIKRRLMELLPEILDKLDKQAKKIKANHKDVKNVATVSVGDEELGEMIAKLMGEIGYDGAVAVDTTKSLETTTEIIKGYTLDRGYMSPYFATESREVKLKDPAIIVTKGVVTDLEDYKLILDPIFKKNIKNVLFIADDIEVDALNTLILNKVKGVLNIVAVKAPNRGEAKEDTLKDIAAITGATLIDPSVGDWQEGLSFETIGAAEKVEVGFDETIIIGGMGDPEPRANALEARLKKAKLDEKDEIEQRIAKLKGKVGIIKVGGASDTEAEEKHYRIVDAVAAVKAALKDGIVAGGGVTLRDVGIDMLPEDPVTAIVRMSLQMPERMLWDNSAIEVPEERIIKPGVGTNVITGEEIVMLDGGIIDPVKVVKEVVRNAFTAASIAISVGGAVVDKQLSQEEMAQLMNMG